LKVELNPDDATAYYNIACAYSLQGNIDAALPPLQRALQLDAVPYLNLIPADPDFDPIRHEPRFQELLTQFDG